VHDHDYVAARAALSKSDNEAASAALPNRRSVLFFCSSPFQWILEIKGSIEY
jgi:hypothetical protein